MEEALGNCIVPSVVFRPIVRASVLYTKYCVHIFCILCFSCMFFFIFIYFCPYISKISLLINIFVLFCLLLIAFVLILQFLLFVVIFPIHSICMYVFFHFIPSPSTHLTTIRKKNIKKKNKLNNTNFFILVVDVCKLILFCVVYAACC